MALIKCPGCGKEVSDKAKKCVHCGRLLNDHQKIEKENLQTICSEEKTDNKTGREDNFEKELENYKHKLELEYQDKLNEHKKKADLVYQEKSVDYQKKVEAELNDKLSSHKQRVENEYQQKIDGFKKRIEDEYQNKVSAYKQLMEEERFKERNEYEERIKNVYNSKVGDAEKEIEKRKAELDREYEANCVKYEARQKIILDDYKKQIYEEIEEKYNQKCEEEKEKYEKEKAELLKLVDDLTKGNDSKQLQEENDTAYKGKKVVPVLAVLCAVLLIINVVQFTVRGNSNKGAENSNEITQSVTETDETISDNQSEQIADTQNEEEVFAGEETESSETDVTTTDSTTSPEGAILSYGSLADGLSEECIFGGVYKCGNDMEPGKYVFISMLTSSSYIISNDAMQNDVVDEESTMFKILELKEKSYIDVDYTAALVPEKEFDQENLQKYGIFTVGKDIEPGEYKIKSMEGNNFKTADGNTWSTGGGTYEIRDDIFSDSQDGVEYIHGEHVYVELKEGQYIILRCAAVFPA